ncbi:MAG: sensor histidine kinase, partial [Rhodoferax sp.]
MKIDWLGKLEYFLQTVAFCLAITAIHYSFRPDQAYAVPLVYSVCIGVTTWALIDFGRHLWPSSADTGWPHGGAGLALPAAGIALGFVLGTSAADALFGWSSWDAQALPSLQGSIVITGMAGVVAIYYFYSRTKQSYLLRRIEQAQRLATESRLKLLETQLEPHMLFNTLANLRALIGADPVRAQHMLDHLIAYLRATLNGSRARRHPLEQEFARLHDYLELMLVRMGPRLQFRLDLPDALRQCPIAPLLLQPLVANSLQHGLEPKLSGGTVTVSARQQGDLLVLEVHDNGL